MHATRRAGGSLRVKVFILQSLIFVLAALMGMGGYLRIGGS